MYRDELERHWILERSSPYWFDLCAYCGSYEGEPHEETCDWVNVREQHNLEIAA